RNTRDNWQVHFRDTMRGGKFMNNPRMAELHAKEAPDRVWELEAWGALFDRTPDGKISQRNFGGHEYPRLAHVGDRTGLEMIRTLQQKTVALQQQDARTHGDPEAMLKVFAETTITRLLTGGGRLAGAFGYARATGRSVPSTRRPRKRPTAGMTTPTTTGARLSCCPATRWPARSTRRSRPAAGPRTAGCSSTSPPGCPPRRSCAGCRPCTTSSRSWRTWTSPRSRWRSADR